MNYTYIVIDPANAISTLQPYLGEYGDLVHAGTCKNTKEGLNCILKVGPDVVLVNLDRNAPSHFQMATDLNRFINNLPLIIGCSSSKKYAYKALKSGFFDYWTLPYDEYDVRKTMFRLRKRHPKLDTPTKLCLKSYNDYQYLDTNDILYLKSDNNATDFFMCNGDVISAYKTLKSFEEQLPTTFIRIHQSYILNSNYVSHISYGRSICTLRIPKEKKIPFSKKYRNRVDSLKKMLSKRAINTLN